MVKLNNKRIRYIVDSRMKDKHTTQELSEIYHQGEIIHKQMVRMRGFLEDMKKKEKIIGHLMSLLIGIIIQSI